jgi:polar amino acid transport system substrate-binding protein
MNLRRPASVGLVCVLAATVGVLSACQNNASTSTPTASAEPLTELQAKVPDKIRADGAMDVGIDPNYPPMEYLERGQAVGADLDLMRAVGEKLGLQVRFAEDAYALLVPGVAAGRFDAAISALSIDDNDLQNANMVTYFQAGSQLAVRPPAKKRFGPRNLCGRKVTVLDGSTQYSQLVERSANCVEGKRKAIRIITFEAQEPATQAVIDGKAYGTLADSPVIQRAVARSNGALVPNGRKFEIAPYGIAVSQQRKQLAQAIRGALQEMIDDGTYQQILDEWDISEGAIDNPQILTRRDIPEPTPLSTESFAPASPAPVPTPTPSF